MFVNPVQGHDTSSAAMTWTMQEIGSHPDVLKKCQEEMREIFGDSDRAPTMDDLNRMEVRFQLSSNIP